MNVCVIADDTVVQTIDMTDDVVISENKRSVSGKARNVVTVFNGDQYETNFIELDNDLEAPDPCLFVADPSGQAKVGWTYMDGEFSSPAEIGP